MRRAHRSLLVVIVVAAMGVCGTVFAYAGGWALADNTAALTAKVARMPRGVEPSVAKQNGEAVVTWTAQELTPGSLMDRYVVTAHRVGGSAKPDVTRTVTASGAATEVATFTAGELAAGTWNWTVTPKFRDWTGDVSRKSRNLTFPAVPSPRQAAPESAPTSPTGTPAVPGSTAGTSAEGTSTAGTSGSPAPSGTTIAPQKKPETRETSPAEPAEPAPQPVESTSGEVEPPPAGP
jgi:hypothetical protein